MLENGSQKTVKVSTLIITLIIVVVILFVIFAAILFFLLKSNNNNSNEVANNVENSYVSSSNTTENEIETNSNILFNNQTSNSTNTESTTQSSSTGTISDNWSDCEFILNDDTYKLDFDYRTLESKGWSLNLADYGYPNGYTLNPQNEVAGSLTIKNSNYDANVTIGFKNNSDTAKDLLDCQINSIHVSNNIYGKKPVSFTLAKGIHKGSSLQDVVNAYGEPKDSYHSDTLGYWTYTYEDENNNTLELTIYEDNNGLTDFRYSK